jgi:hypothetical protein
MDVKDILQQLQIKLGLSGRGLSRRLGLKAESHVYMVLKGHRNFNRANYRKLMKLCKESGVEVVEED